MPRKAKSAAVEKKVVKKVAKVVKKLAKQPRPTRALTPTTRGHGSYGGDLGSAAATVAARATGLPASIAAPIGGWVGDKIGSGLEKAGNWFSKLLGFGAYRVRRNSLMRAAPAMNGYTGSGYPTNSPPIFNSSMQSSDIEVAHREFVGNVKSSVNFRATKYAVNPGNSILHPWLSKMAGLYEEYDLLGMVFEYKPTSAMAVGTTSSAMGVVVMASDYDPYDDNFTSKRAMEAAEYSTSGAPFEIQMHPIECDSKRNVLRNQYVVPGIVNPSDAPGDARFSIHCATTIATEGQQLDDTVIGELWVTSHYRFSRPILEDNMSNMKVIRQTLSLTPIGASVIVLDTAVKNTTNIKWENASGSTTTRNATFQFPKDWYGRYARVGLKAYSTGAGDGFFNPVTPYAHMPPAAPPNATTFPPWFADTTYGSSNLQLQNSTCIATTFDPNHNPAAIPGFKLDVICKVPETEADARMNIPLPVTGNASTILGTLTITEISMPDPLPLTLDQQISNRLAALQLAPTKAEVTDDVVTLDDVVDEPNPPLLPLQRGSRANSRK